MRLSALSKTWIFDLDGTVLRHNGHKSPEGDFILDGAKEFFDNLSPDDFVVFITSREQIYADCTEAFLKKNGIRWNHIIYGAPVGERILINDTKPSGLPTAYAVNTARNIFMDCEIQIDREL
jgi:hypothetical protein